MRALLVAAVIAASTGCLGTGMFTRSESRASPRREARSILLVAAAELAVGSLLLLAAARPGAPGDEPDDPTTFLPEDRDDTPLAAGLLGVTIGTMGAFDLVGGLVQLASGDYVYASEPD